MTSSSRASPLGVPRLVGALALWLACVSHAAAATDAPLAELQGRIDALEQRLAEIERQTPACAGPRGAMAPAGAASRQPEVPSAAQDATQSVPQPVPQSVPQSARQHVRADDELARALERALVREGGLLLPPAAIEIEPRWSYQYGSSMGLELTGTAAAPQLARIDRRRTLQQAGIGLRVGLPSRWQFDLLVPYLSLHQRQSVSGGVSSSDSTSGFGAAEIGLSHEVRPVSAGTGVVAALRWSEPASAVFERASALAPASGFASLQASVLFVTRRDPVVFIGALSQAWRQSRRVADQAIAPGDTTGLRAGAIIALSPEISLRLGLELAHTGSTRVDGVAVGGTGGVSGEFSTGFSLVLSPRVLLGIEAGIGLTSITPDFRVGLSLPIRF